MSIVLFFPFEHRYAFCAVDVQLLYISFQCFRLILFVYICIVLFTLVAAVTVAVSLCVFSLSCIGFLVESSSFSWCKIMAFFARRIQNCRKTKCDTTWKWTKLFRISTLLCTAILAKLSLVSKEDNGCHGSLFRQVISSHGIGKVGSMGP